MHEKYNEALIIRERDKGGVLDLMHNRIVV